MTLAEKFSEDEQYEGMLFADGFDEAFLGVGWRFSDGPLAVYDRNKIIDILIDEGGTEEEAEEHFQYNIIGGWVGEFTPIFMIPAEELNVEIYDDRS